MRGDPLRKNQLLPPLLVLLLLLTGCGGPSPMEEARRLQEMLAEATEIRLEADVTADYGERVYRFRLAMETLPEGWRVRILEPENLSGVSAVSREGALKLEIENLILDTGDLSPAGLCPMNALPVAADAWKSGHLAEALYSGKEQNLSLCFDVSDDTRVQTLFVSGSATPLSAEIIVDGVSVLFLAFRSAEIR